MIGRSSRFHGINSLRHVYARGQIVRSPHVATKFIMNDRRRSYRAAVVVSRKVHKSAVIRNRIRRRIYEIIRQQAPFIRQPFDIVVTVFSEHIADMPAKTLESLVVGQLRKAGIVQQAPPEKPHAIVERKEK